MISSDKNGNQNKTKRSSVTWNRKKRKPKNNRKGNSCGLVYCKCIRIIIDCCELHFFGSYKFLQPPVNSFLCDPAICLWPCSQV